MKNTKKWICPCDEARSCDMLKEAIGDENILVITSKTNKRYNWDEHDRIIFSPKVIYGLIQSWNALYSVSIKRRQLTPVTCYNRSIVIVILRNSIIYSRERNVETQTSTHFKIVLMIRIILKNGVIKIIISIKKFQGFIQSFKKIFNELKYNQDCYKSNPYAHFKKLLIERGFNDKTNIHQSISKNTREMLKVDKERMIESIHKDLPYVKEKNEYIGLPEEEIENHKEIFYDRNFIGHFIGLKTYIFDKMGQTYNPEEKKWVDEYTDELTRLQDWNMKNKDKLFKSEEFNIKKIKTNINKMLYIEKLRNDIGINDRLKITDFNLLSNEKADDYYEEYKAIFTDRSTKEKENPLYTEKGTQRFLGMLYKKTFGINPFPEQSTSENGKTIRKFMDAELKDFDVYNVVYEKAKMKKIDDLEKGSIHSGECLLD
jgi:hypothetical protein